MTYTDSNYYSNYPPRRYSYADSYQKSAYTQAAHIQHGIPIKVESVDSPDLLPPLPSHRTLSQFSQQKTDFFRFGDSHSGSASTPSPVTPATPFTFMSSHHWPSATSPVSASAAGSSSYQHHQQYATERMHGYSLSNTLNGHSHSHPHSQSHASIHPHAHAHIHSHVHDNALPMHDEYDDGEDDGLSDLPSAGIGISLGSYGSAGLSSAGGTQGKNGEKAIRRRSSKACDQCRKSKCKCERSSPQEPCRNCVMLGTACTFLGPSRKRGPPKGYIDAIEARLHQTEALIGILLSSKDSRAKTLLEDLSEDALAKEIINRVNNSPYGHKGRSRGAEASGSGRSRPAEQRGKEDGSSLQSTHPSNEWQDAVTSMLNKAATQRNTLLPTDEQVYGEIEDPEQQSNANAGAISSSFDGDGLGYPSEDDVAPTRISGRPTLSLHPSITASNPSPSLLTPHSATTADHPQFDNSGSAAGRRTRRRVEAPADHLNDPQPGRSPSTASLSGRSRSPARYAYPPPHPALLSKTSVSSLRGTGRLSGSPEVRDMQEADNELSEGGEASGSGEDELALAVGQLSINEDEQVRYHGKASGLHLLDAQERLDGRSENGIWRFPKARVWPPLPPNARSPKQEEEVNARLPDLAVQEHLLELYFTYVHPALPILHKRTFLQDFRNGNVAGASPSSPLTQDTDAAASPVNSRRSSTSSPRRIPALLLLAMFSVSARYSSTSAEAPLPSDGSMWTAGDSYLEDAKVILDRTYAASRPSTCQALLLLGYREVGIGAMAQAWLYIGMAVRMAQDLGLHKAADKWSNVGRSLFSPEVLQERRRIWYGCVIMDKYVSAYIGRPVAIFETDFDTELPSVDEDEELELWAPHPSPLLLDASGPAPAMSGPLTGHILSCFNESAKISIILSMIIQSIYAIRHHNYRQGFAQIDKLLQKWYLDLPEHLRFDPLAIKPAPQPPHVLTLHMQYWCAVLLLHRPFIHNLHSDNKSSSNSTKDHEVSANSRKNYNMCVQAANHITSTVSVYVENHCVHGASVYLCYYVFTAAVMHIATLKIYPSDTQASVGLHKCMDVLQRMQNVWPSAWRAYQLISGAKVQPEAPRPAKSPATMERHKRTADRVMEEEVSANTRVPESSSYRQSHHYGPISPQNPSHQGFPLSLDLPSGESPGFYQSYDRWTGDGGLSNFPGSLSTSVLPQQYSTGLVDDRIQRHQERPSQRYPQYWNDYSALGQIDTTYVPVIGDMVSQPTGPAQPDPSHMYEQYSVFDNMSHGGH